MVKLLNLWEETSKDFTADLASLRDDVAKLSSSLSELFAHVQPRRQTLSFDASIMRGKDFRYGK